MMYITVNEHRLVARRPGCRDSGFLPLTAQRKWPGTTTRLVAASQIAGTGPKRRSLASPDRLALLTQSYKVTANVTKDSPLTTWHLKVRSRSSRMVRRPGCRERQMAGRQWGWGGAEEERPHPPPVLSVCLGTMELRPATGSCPRPSHPRTVVTDPRSIIHQLQPEKERMHRKPSSLHTAHSPALLKGWEEGFFICHTHIIDIVYLSYIWCMYTCINTKPSFRYIICIYVFLFAKHCTFFLKKLPV